MTALPPPSMDDGYGGQVGGLMLQVGFPSNHFTARAGHLLAEAAQALATSAEGESGAAYLYGPEQGSPAYRQELAKFLSTEYGEPVKSDHLQVTAGATHGLHLVTTQLFHTGDVVFMEDPTYFIAVNMLKKDLGMTIIGVPTDEEGIDVDKLEELVVKYNKNSPRHVTSDRPFSSMLYTIPTFHNPTGRCLSEARCRRLIELGHKHKILLFCDDVYNLLYYGDVPIPRRLLSYEIEMFGEEEGNVVSNGTFSKILCPGIRVGWIESSSRIIDILRGSNIALSGGSFNHYGSHLVTHLLHTGLEQNLVESMRTEHTSRVNAVNAVLSEMLPCEVKFVPPQGGYFYWLELPKHVDMEKVTQTGKQKGVSFIKGQLCSPCGNFENCIRFSISKYQEPELVKAVSLLCEAIKECL